MLAIGLILAALNIIGRCIAKAYRSIRNWREQSKLEKLVAKAIEETLNNPRE